MIKLTINEKEFTVAEKWEDVTFGQYIDVANINKDTFSDLQKSIKIIAAMSDNPEELEMYLYELDTPTYDAIGEHLTWIKTSFVEEANKYEATGKFTIDGKEYCIKKNHETLSLGEMISCEETLKNPNINYQEVGLAIILREVIDGKEAPFNLEFFNYVLTDLKYKINLLEVYKYIVFFSTSEKESSKKSSKGFSVVKI